SCRLTSLIRSGSQSRTYQYNMIANEIAAATRLEEPIPMYEHITVERLGAVTRITQNRPDRRNAQNERMLDELDAAFAEAERDETCRVVILAGAGDHF